jgi:ABC-type sugar transport system substrate-binding protein
MEEGILRKALRRLTVLSPLFVLVLCGQLAHAQDANKLKIGFSIEDMKGERWQTDLNSFEARAKQLGAEVISRDAGGDDDLQFKQVKGRYQSAGFTAARQRESQPDGGRREGGQR